MTKIVHISTIHPRRDTRVFYRECLSLKKAGYDVIFIVADGKGDENFKDIKIIDIGKFKSRFKNFIFSYFILKKIINKIKPSIVHFHDAELMFVGKFLSNKGIDVFYDIHENVAMQILVKSYIPLFLRKPLKFIYVFTEKLLINNFHLILAEDSYKPLYENKGKTCTVVLNLPETNAFDKYIKANRMNEKGIFYIGGVSNVRGLDTTVEALKILNNRNIDFFMHYVGPISSDLLKEVNLNGIENKIKFYGRLDLLEGYSLSRKCKVGLAVLKPIKNYIESYPTKIFEYMSIKLPLITSDFPLYKNVVEKNNCGFCINPYSANELADYIQRIFEDDNLSNKIAVNGYNLVKNKFNWETQEIKLLNCYNVALNERNRINNK